MLPWYSELVASPAKNTRSDPKVPGSAPAEPNVAPCPAEWQSSSRAPMGQKLYDPRCNGSSAQLCFLRAGGGGGIRYCSSIKHLRASG